MPFADPAAAIARFRLTLELHDEGVGMMRQNLRRRHPEADDATIESLLQAWLHHRPGAEFGDAEGRPIPWPRR